MQYKNVKIMEVDDDVFMPLSMQPEALIERLETVQCILCNKNLTSDVDIMYVEFTEKNKTLWWHTFTSGHDYIPKGCHEDHQISPKSYQESYSQVPVDTLNK